MKQTNHVRDVIRKIAGIVLIVLGTFGLFLPLLQGIALIIAGAYLLQNDWLLKKLRKLKRRR